MEGHTQTTLATHKMWNYIISTAGSQRVLEIGFNLGHSARIFLEFGLEVHSIDIGENKGTESIMKHLAFMNKNFSYEVANSWDLDYRDYTGYDMMFVDGGHDTVTVLNDILLGVKAGIKWIIVDDYDGKWFGNIIQTVDFMNKRGVLKLRDCLSYDASDGKNTLAILQND